MLAADGIHALELKREANERGKTDTVTVNRHIISAVSHCRPARREMNEPKKKLPACPVETTLTLIGDKWKVLILRDLMPGTKRFGELKRSIGSVSQKVLTSQLRDMEKNGLVNRKVYAEVPPRVEYSLTDLGRSLKPILDAMWNWGERYKSSQESDVNSSDVLR